MGTRAGHGEIIGGEWIFNDGLFLQESFVIDRWLLISVVAVVFIVVGERVATVQLRLNEVIEKVTSQRQLLIQLLDFIGNDGVVLLLLPSMVVKREILVEETLLLDFECFVFVRGLRANQINLILLLLIDERDVFDAIGFPLVDDGIEV